MTRSDQILQDFRRFMKLADDPSYDFVGNPLSEVLLLNFMMLRNVESVEAARGFIMAAIAKVGMGNQIRELLGFIETNLDLAIQEAKLRNRQARPNSEWDQFFAKFRDL